MSAALVAMIDFSMLADAMSFSAGSALPLETGSGSGHSARMS
ncbi:MAG: hypothetical protein P8Y47_13735 [Alphaproteobacteria bacterium]